MKNQTNNTVDISYFLEQIEYGEDKIIFDEAVKSANVGALRSAYIMIWISCAESLKRRFKTMQHGDNEVIQIVKDITSVEESGKPVDKILIAKAKHIDIINQYEHDRLELIYKGRCVYGHPYEVEPSIAQIVSAASEVTEIVLSKTIQMKQNYCRRILKNLIEDKNYVEHTEEAITDYFEKIFPRIHESVYSFFLKEYLTKLKKVLKNPDKKFFFNRGIYFYSIFLEKVGCKLFDDIGWHQLVQKYPSVLLYILLESKFYDNIGTQAQDYIFEATLENIGKKPSLLKNLTKLEINTYKQNKLDKILNDNKDNICYKANLEIKQCYKTIIGGLKLHDWYIYQNPAIDFVLNSLSQIKDLNVEQQQELGRNILQSASGRAKSAYDFLNDLETYIDDLAIDFIKGLIFECFVNEKNEFRDKMDYFDKVYYPFKSTRKDDCNQTIDELVELIKKSKSKRKNNKSYDLEELENYEIKEDSEDKNLKKIYEIIESKSSD